MMPGFGGMSPKKMGAMMSKMGIKQDSIDDAKRVVIERDSGDIVIENPSVTKVTMQGQETWQIVGDVREESEPEGINEEDVKLVAEKTGKSEEEARKALEETGDIAATIVKLSR